ncbi:helix-turn-helix transcriptional regulator [Candidatus Bathyarchaeota archaeon]|nr:helix-turn-helix transcriptional regulator [Candidatus Bathyarchaeota archaeon]
MRYQGREAGRNQARILRILSERPATFTELLKETGFSRSTLNAHLKALGKGGLIFRMYDEARGRVLTMPGAMVDLKNDEPSPSSLLKRG